MEAFARRNQARVAAARSVFDARKDETRPDAA